MIIIAQIEYVLNKKLATKPFFDQKKYEEIRRQRLETDNGWLLFVATESGFPRAQRCIDLYNNLLQQTDDCGKYVQLISRREDGNWMIKTHGDTETNPRIPINVAGANVFLFSDPHSQHTKCDVNSDIWQTGQVAWTLKAHRAKTINWISPYLAYSRADAESYLERETGLVAYMADKLKGDIDHILCYDLHNNSVKLAFQPQIRVLGLSGLHWFVDLFGGFHGDAEAIDISTDAGGAKKIVRQANKLNHDYAIIAKLRDDEGAKSLGVVGEFENKKKGFVTDDETATFTSLLGAAEKVSNLVDELYIAISHLKLTKEHVPKIYKAMKDFNLKKLYVTDSVPQTQDILDIPCVEQMSLDLLLTHVINRMHYNQSVSDLVL